jgi:competence transcription factor ComK
MDLHEHRAEHYLANIFRDLWNSDHRQTKGWSFNKYIAKLGILHNDDYLIKFAEQNNYLDLDMNEESYLVLRDHLLTKKFHNDIIKYYKYVYMGIDDVDKPITTKNT